MDLPRLYAQLEFDRLLTLAAGYCQSNAACERMKTWQVSFAPQDIERNLNETTEALLLLEEKLSREHVDFSLLPENTDFLAHFHAGMDPERDDIKLLGDLLNVCTQATKRLRKLNQRNYPTLTETLSSFVDLGELAQRFARTFAAEGEVKDNASPHLKLIRGRLARLQLRVEQQIRSIIKKRAPEAAEELHLSIRNNRLTVNLPVGMLRSFKGMIVDYSATGASVYLEPEEVVELNNQRQELFLEEETEARRIRQRFGAEVAAHEEALCCDFNLLVQLDLALGRARYSQVIGGHRPEISAEGQMHLTQARYPLMASEFVPETLSFGPEKELIISGVNAGGKSLLLKMMGLFALMTYTGLLVPADEGTVIGLFDSLWVDITDEQSVLSNLSTFTAHLKFLDELFAHLSHKQASSPLTLVLIDELGTGTDPEEGAALGYALMEHLLVKPVKVAATTHYDLIKTLGEKEPQCKNVSMGFDEAGLSPTYEVLEGLPGKSFAFDIAAGQSFSPEILERARELVASGETSFADAVRSLRAKQADLEAERQKLIREQESVHRASEKLNGRQEAVARREIELRRRLESLRRDFEEAADSFLEHARKEINERIRTGKRRTPLEVGSKFAADFRKQKQNLLVNLEQALGLTPASAASLVDELAAGAHLQLPSLGIAGKIVRIDEKKGKLQVLAHGKRITLDLVDVRKLLLEAVQIRGARTGILETPEAVSRERAKLGSQLDAGVASRQLTTAHQLDLHGHTKEEALPKLEKFISDAIYHDFDTVMIMHGVGSGALRAFIHDHLRRSEYVKAFRDASTEEGGKGTTIVELK